MVRVTVRVPKRYFRENLGAPFVIAFQVMLLLCAFLLIRGYSALANEVAVYAYYSLVVGVVLQLICFMKYREKSAE